MQMFSDVGTEMFTNSVQFRANLFLRKSAQNHGFTDSVNLTFHILDYVQRFVDIFLLHPILLSVFGVTC